MTKASLKAAVTAYNVDPAAATATYGPVAEWEVSEVTDMSYLFYWLTNFNADISNWKTSGVTTMANMFSGACKRHARKGLTMDAGARHVRGAR